MTLDFDLAQVIQAGNTPTAVKNDDVVATTEPIQSSQIIPTVRPSPIASSKVPPPVGVQDGTAGRTWWYVQAGHQMGPVTQEEMLSSIATGNVSRTDMAWCERMPAWKPIASIEAFAQTGLSNPAKPPPIDQAVPNSILEAEAAMKPLVDSLQVLRQKISRNNAYLGIMIGFAVFCFALFLSWASIPTGLMAKDGGAVSGWSELAFLAIIPLAFALYPVFLQRSVELKTLIINIVIAFGLLGYNNVIKREMWHNDYGNMGSILSAGFWVGLLAMVTLSVCGVAWSLHTSGEKD